ncbi:MAG TPA: hypothetical protein VLB68_09635 [Pyrinomonadaceae bacterium]|nr:hypothetical protein [Pyrinomonadaceae bacterium]
MKQPASGKLGLWLRVVVCLVAANLLFSVSEGLQLGPFSSIPHPHVAQAVTSADLDTAANAHHINPMETTPVRKSEKRQSTAIDLPPVVHSLASHLTVAYLFATAPASVTATSYSQSIGRAPPRL